MLLLRVFRRRGSSSRQRAKLERWAPRSVQADETDEAFLRMVSEGDSGSTLDLEDLSEDASTAENSASGERGEATRSQRLGELLPSAAHSMVRKLFYSVFGKSMGSELLDIVINFAAIRDAIDAYLQEQAASQMDDARPRRKVQMVRLVLNLACIAKQCMTEQPLRYLQPLGARFCEVADLTASAFLDELLLWLYFADAVYSSTEESIHAYLDEKLSMRNKALAANFSRQQRACGGSQSSNGTRGSLHPGRKSSILSRRRNSRRSTQQSTDYDVPYVSGRMHGRGVTILHMRSKGTVLEPCFFVASAASSGASSVIVSVRGTFSLRDLVTDLSVKPTILEEKAGSQRQAVHVGALRSARNIAAVVRPIIEPLLKAGPAKLVLCGHSLGGAVASLLMIVLATEGPLASFYMYLLHERRMSCYCYGPPPTLAAPETFPSVITSACTTVINGFDCVARITARSLAKAFLAADQVEGVSLVDKIRYLRGRKNPFAGQPALADFVAIDRSERASLLNEIGIFPSRARDRKLSIWSKLNPKKDLGDGNPLLRPMYPLGRLLLLHRLAEEDAFVCEPLNNRVSLDRLLFHPAMTEDHKTTSYMSALSSAIQHLPCGDATATRHRSTILPRRRSQAHLAAEPAPAPGKLLEKMRMRTVLLMAPRSGAACSPSMQSSSRTANGSALGGGGGASGQATSANRHVRDASISATSVCCEVEPPLPTSPSVIQSETRSSDGEDLSEPSCNGASPPLSGSRKE